MWKINKAKKQPKLGNIKTSVGGVRFDSKKESRRHAELKLLECSGDISCLELQKKYVLTPSQKKTNGEKERPWTYTADFVYKDKDGNVIVEDVKGFKKGGSYASFVKNRKMMLFRYGIEVIET